MAVRDSFTEPSINSKEFGTVNQRRDRCGSRGSQAEKGITPVLSCLTLGLVARLNSMEEHNLMDKKIIRMKAARDEKLNAEKWR